MNKPLQKARRQPVLPLDFFQNQKGIKITPRCTASSECSDATPICDTECKACTEDTKCKDKDATKPFCVTATDATNKGKCVACLTNSACSVAATPICDASANTCNACKNDAECKEKDASKPTCELTADAANLGECVEKTCTTNDDCKENGAATECKESKCVTPVTDSELCTTACDLGRPLFTVAAMAACSGSLVYGVVSGASEEEDSSYRDDNSYGGYEDSSYEDYEYEDSKRRRKRQAEGDEDPLMTILAPSTVCPVSYRNSISKCIQ